MGSWQRHGGIPNPIDGPSDGYATALVTLALCELGVADAVGPARRGVQWLRSNQRESGRWFTGSLFAVGFQNYLSNMGTAYALMAMHRCEPVG
jgi:squalene-hopene/tetraprenyl-beta-curcumene cyclase